MGWLSSVFSFFSSGVTGISVIPLACSLAFGGLWLYERHNSQDLAVLNGQLTLSNVGQAAAITRLRAGQAISEQILIQREATLENIHKTVATDKSEIAKKRRTDEELAAWLAAPLPAHVAGLLGEPDRDANRNREVDSASGAAARETGADPARP